MTARCFSVAWSVDSSIPAPMKVDWCGSVLSCCSLTPLKHSTESEDDGGSVRCIRPTVEVKRVIQALLL